MGSPEETFKFEFVAMPMKRELEQADVKAEWAQVSSRDTGHTLSDCSLNGIDSATDKGGKETSVNTSQEQFHNLEHADTLAVSVKEEIDDSEQQDCDVETERADANVEFSQISHPGAGQIQIYYNGESSFGRVSNVIPITWSPEQNDAGSGSDLVTGKHCECAQCGEVYSNKTSLKNHMRDHKDLGNYERNKRKSSKKETATSYMTVSKVENIHGCLHCGKTFRYRAQLKKHLMIHSGEKPHSCSICEKSFRRKEHLKRHQIVHSGEKTHICKQCGKSFGQKEHLNAHLTVHSAEKPHSCSECGKSFGLKETLKIHIMIHSGEKTHGCSECGKSFRHKRHLTQHQMIHSGEKPHSCAKCGKSFRQKEHLTRHQLIHSNDNF